MPSQKPQRFQLSLKQIFALVLLVSLGSIIYAYLNPPLRLTEVSRYPITVDYSRSIEKGIAAGRYDWQHSRITTANFPAESGKSGKLAQEAVAIAINKLATAEEIMKAMDRKDLRPATIRELLAFGEAYPEFQRDNFVVALGSTWQDSDGHLYVPVLCSGDGGYRKLFLYIQGGRWLGHYRFLVFAK